MARGQSPGQTVSAPGKLDRIDRKEIEASITIRGAHLHFREVAAQRGVQAHPQTWRRKEEAERRAKARRDEHLLLGILREKRLRRGNPDGARGMRLIHAAGRVARTSGKKKRRRGRKKLPCSRNQSPTTQGSFSEGSLDTLVGTRKTKSRRHFKLCAAAPRTIRFLSGEPGGAKTPSSKACAAISPRASSAVLADKRIIHSIFPDRGGHGRSSTAAGRRAP